MYISSSWQIVILDITPLLLTSCLAFTAHKKAGSISFGYILFYHSPNSWLRELKVVSRAF